MTEINIKKIIEQLIDTFFYAGKICLEWHENPSWYPSSKGRSELTNAQLISPFAISSQNISADDGLQ